jgi:hypothetical protein
MNGSLRAMPGKTAPAYLPALRSIKINIASPPVGAVLIFRGWVWVGGGGAF